MECLQESQYIGLTTQTAKKRWGAHRNSTTPLIGKKMSSVGAHFSRPGHSSANMRFVILEQVVSKDPFVLKARETFWIRNYQSVLHGLNKEE